MTVIGSHTVAVVAAYMRDLADSPVFFNGGNENPPEPSWLMSASENLRDYAEILRMRGDLNQAIASLRPSVKTRDVGTCNHCRKNTQSGMDYYCHRCAWLVLENFLKTFLAATTEPIADDGDATNSEQGAPSGGQKE